MMNTSTLDPVSVTLHREESSQSTFGQKMFLLDPVSIYHDGGIITRLMNFMKIEDNWDGNGANAPSMSALLNAIFLIGLLPRQVVSVLEEDDIYISLHGTIIIDLEKEDKLLSIEVGDDMLGYFLEENDQIIDTKNKEPFVRLGLSLGLTQATDWLLK